MENVLHKRELTAHRNHRFTDEDRERIRRPDTFHGPDREFNEFPEKEETVSLKQLIRKCI